MTNKNNPPKWETKKRLKRAASILFNVLLMVFLFETMGGWGLGGYFLALIIFAIYRTIKGRVMLKNTLRYIETMVWGKPLEKDFWDKGELKKRKVKVTWNRKKRSKL